MNTQINIYEGKALEYLKMLGINAETNEQAQVFLNICKEYQLSPFKKEIHLTVYDTKNGKVITPIVSYHVYLRLAARHEHYDNFTYEYGSDDYGEFCKVVVNSKVRKPLTHICYAKEWLNENNPMHKKSPKFMLMKIAVSQAIRLAFPEIFETTIYTEEEMQRDAVVETAQVVSTAPVSNNVVLHYVDEETANVIEYDIDSFLKDYKNIDRFKFILQNAKTNPDKLTETEKAFIKTHYKKLKHLLNAN